ncbi:Maf family nucleotide pyrophosphatase [Marinobacter sp. CHS3-4]|uniref:Maf family protein n=1 Tax=Marinobacter sp. CHS3-4 TaxID=3045174 RepID=UPI0024B4F8FD|nr:Maf family nucleotide pyrophosphatase [Marinobacter sp. CHS3-4]MDI9245809.1 Maf family nucleotide pyrophosphatase [Marinobacter sp. CHS3-4]
MEHPPLLLASSSPYRKALLSRLALPFETASPDIDETPYESEPPEELATRLAEQKAEALAQSYPAHWIIGSDQVASLSSGETLSKPGDHEHAVAQLMRSSGRTVTFYTGLCLLNAANGDRQIHCETFHAHFRHLSTAEIEHYVTIEQPFDCAGSFKMEGLGIVLFESLEGRDPNSLIGLPLIALTNMLTRWGLNPLLAASPSAQITL